MGVLLAKIVERSTGCRTAAILSALIVGLATPIFTYSQAFYGHIPAAACVVGALALLVLTEGPVSDQRLFGVGLLLGTAVLVEYPAALAGLPVAVLALVVARWRAAILGVLGASAPLALLAIYDLVAFGTPMPVGYEHSTLWQDQHQTGFLSLTSPSVDALWGLTGGQFRGLFVVAPVLLLALPGVVIGLRTRATRRLTLTACASFVAMLLFAGSSVMWWGGFAVGPRYVLPAVPLLAIPLGCCIAWANRLQPAGRLAGLGLVVFLGVVSATLTWGLTLARQGYPPDTIPQPISQYMWPALREGDVARNLGMAVGLDGLLSLAPLVLILVLGVGVVGLGRLRSREATA
jgi:hypothetical protein